MQTETPLYVSDVLGEIDNTETATVEPEFHQGEHRPGLALRIADRRAAIREGSERGDYIAWLALAVLAALILVGLVKAGIAGKIGDGINYEICKITHTGSDGSDNTAKGKKNCDGDQVK